VLARRGLEEERQLLTYHGATTKRDEVRRRFLEDPNVMVLAATDAASEGINLQLSCNHLVHVEVPWNPNRYEQRNGRIDRYGQRETPRIILLVARGYVEQRAAEIVLTKLEQIAKDLGSVSNVAPFAKAVPIEQYLADHAGDGEKDEDVEAVAAGLAARLDEAIADTSDAVPQELLSGDRFERHELDAVEDELAEAAAFAPSFDDVRLFLARYLGQDGGSITEVPGELGVYRVRPGEHLRVVTGVEELSRATFDRALATAEASLPRAQRVHFLSPGHPVVMAALRRARS
jgi:Helicase conserved C-terminal domain